MAKYTITELQHANAEEAVTKLADAFDVPEKDIVALLELGLQIQYSSKVLHPRSAELIEELKATFDAY
jgi:hypothetical protein